MERKFGWIAQMSGEIRTCGNLIEVIRIYNRLTRFLVNLNCCELWLNQRDLVNLNRILVISIRFLIRVYISPDT